MEVSHRLMVGQLYPAQEIGIMKAKASKSLKTSFSALAKSQAPYLIM